MISTFNYTGTAELISVRDGSHGRITDFDEEMIPLKIYQYKVADDMLVEVLVSNKKTWRGVYVRDFLTNKDGRIIAWTEPALIFNKQEAKKYLTDFGLPSKKKRDWVEDKRRNLIKILNEAGYHLNEDN